MKANRFLAITMLLLFVTFVKAQDKYEFGVATFHYVGGKYDVITSFDRETKIVESGKMMQNQWGFDFTPINKTLDDLSGNGWEVYNTNTVMEGGIFYHFYLRKKKN